MLPPLVGIGLKPAHYRDVLETGPDARLPGWLEVHPQNYFVDGGPPHRWLSAVAERYPLSFHSVGLSIGTAQGLDEDELEQLAQLCARYEPASVSDHLSWSGNTDDRYPDLLPIAYTRATLEHVAGQVARAQDWLGRTMLIENPSRYLAFAHDEMDEVDFLDALCRRTGCGLLFDINNVEVSCTNLQLDPEAYIDAIDAALVGEIHLAGHATEWHDNRPLLIDDHGSHVTDRTWALFDRFVRRAGARPVLIEWDTNLPDYAVLIAEAERAGSIMARATAAVAA
ncbi:MNIO family bufferin maturase [Blastomonas sp.]|uniref:MNIO family bufferin maturase n=1 Tax=Blastomonas sp. TaxID=1909299 RepID=UPI00406A3D59